MTQQVQLEVAKVPSASASETCPRAADTAAGHGETLEFDSGYLERNRSESAQNRFIWSSSANWRRTPLAEVSGPMDQMEWTASVYAGSVTT